VLIGSRPTNCNPSGKVSETAALPPRRDVPLRHERERHHVRRGAVGGDLDVHAAGSNWAMGRQGGRRLRYTHTPRCQAALDCVGEPVSLSYMSLNGLLGDGPRVASHCLVLVAGPCVRS
jgi:hypothetical protein